ncbi:dirigent protein 25-like [Prunus avium]|uniref:Dirigent protein n=1 Tax=Prunus avium TaxID=42229 RepID=A0A6P5SIU3_PRUAV|nr:dirigent protein 25-like [Prunus avium]
MANHPSMLTMACFLLLVTTTTNQSSAAAARSLDNSTPTHPHHNHHEITFLMRDVLNVTHPSSKSKPATTKVTSQLPFSKPLGLFPPNGGIPLPETNPTTQSLDLPGIGLFFPARATLQELEFGIVTLIDEDMFESSGFYGSQVIGKAQGIYVASSEDGSSHMMALTAYFADSEFKDGLRFFGVHRTDVHEGSHIAVIGGIGKYVGANGYATVKAENAGEEGNKLLRLKVYLS